MTINATTAKNNYTGDGTTTTFAYSFTVHDQKNIDVYIDSGDGAPVRQNLITDYTVTGVNESSGGTIVFTTAPASTDAITIVMRIPYSQELDYSPTERFAMDTHERGLDNVTNMFKRLIEVISRVLKLKISTTLDADDITISPVANQFVKWNNAADDLATAELTDDHGIADIVDDTTPALGGDLDANANSIQFDDATGFEDDSGNEQLIFQKTSSAVNYVEITNAATTGSPSIEGTGSDTNVDLTLAPKGSGRILVGNLSIPDGQSIADANGNEELTFNTTTSAVNQLEITNAATGNNPLITPSGSDTNIGLNIQPQGTGSLTLLGTSDTAAELRLFEDTDNGSNYVGIKAPTSLSSSINITLPNADGTNGQSLISDGSGNLSFDTLALPDGSWELLGTATASASTTVEFTSLISSSYDVYKLEMERLIPATDNDFWFQTSTDNGSTWNDGASDYRYVFAGYFASTEEDGGGLIDNAFISGPNTGLHTDSAGAGLSGALYIFDPLNASSYTFGYCTVFSEKTSTSAWTVERTAFHRLSAEANNAIRVSTDAANIASGVFRFYGLANS